MRITMTVAMDNEAFTDPAAEVSRILSEIALRVNLGGVDLTSEQGFRVFDINGNTVGYFDVRPDLGNS